MSIGYSGYVFAIKPENIFGKNFSRATADVKCGSYYRNRPHFDEHWNSITKECYENPAKVDGTHNMVPTRKVCSYPTSAIQDLEELGHS